MNSRSKYK